MHAFVLPDSTGTASYVAQYEPNTNAIRTKVGGFGTKQDPN
jgi:hypothetical protein